MDTRPTRIAVVGDVHGCWDLREDEKALQFLQPDLVLFTGDFEYGNLEIIKSIKKLKFHKAFILGNHDTWGLDDADCWTETVEKEHVGYHRLDFPTLKLSVVGGRPFSRGGGLIFESELISRRYDVHDMDGSAQRILQSALGTPDGHTIIFLAHCGPRGLGTQINDICGKDWRLKGGDNGDEDLARVIDELANKGLFSIPLVVFGHMHDRLKLGKGRRKLIAHGANDIIYINGAIVPRVKNLFNMEGAHKKSSEIGTLGKGTVREFMVVDMLGGNVLRITETWVSVVGDVCTLREENILHECKKRDLHDASSSSTSLVENLEALQM